MPLGCEVLPAAMPDPSLAQPARVEVTEAVGASTTFSLFYDFHIEDGDLPLLRDARLGPDAEIAVRVPDGAAPAVLVRGPVTRQRIRLVTGGAGSVLEVAGADALLPLGREHKVRVWPTTSDAAALTELLGLGLPARVNLPSGAVHAESRYALVQREPDLQLARRLARRNGCWLWLEYEPASALAMARVERPPVDAAPALTLHLAGAGRNIDEATLEWDVDRVTGTAAEGRDVFAATDLDGAAGRAPLAPLAAQALADIVGAPRQGRLAVPVADAGDLAARAEAALIEEAWFVRVALRASLRVLGRVIRAHTVVTLEGAGARHSGNYLVARVHHAIDDADHTMDVTLIRNGWN